MTTRTCSRTSYLLWICMACAAAAPVWADTVVDDFDRYPDGLIVGPSATSSPWRRFGGATNDNIVATMHERWVIRGDGSALYGAVWPGSFGAVRYVYEEPTDLSQYDRLTVIMKSNRNESDTQVRLAISNGHTTYVSTGERTLTGRPQTMTFRLSQNQLIRSVGEVRYHDVIHGVTSLGFDFHNQQTEGYETIVFDEIFLLNPGSDQETSTKVSALD